MGRCGFHYFPTPANSVGKWVTILLTSTTLTTWTPTVFPTMLFITAIAGGGAGGGKSAAAARGGGGGGSGHYCIQRPMWINDGTALNYICGTGGAGVNGATGGAGSPTYFGNDKSSGYDGPGYIYLNGGSGGLLSGTSDGGAGGGWLPAAAPTNIGAAVGHSVRQQIFHWAGAAGGCGGEAAGQTSSLAGELEATKSAAAGTGNASSGGGGPGGSGFGPGAAGTTGVAGNVAGINAGFYGSGGSGANGSDLNLRVGGNGAQGAIYVTYWDPNGDTTHGWIYEKLGGTASAAAGNFTPTYLTGSDVLLFLYGTAAGGSAGGRNNATNNTPGAGGSGEYFCGMPYQWLAAVAYSIPGETAKPAAGDNDGNIGGDLTWDFMTLKGGGSGKKASVRTSGAGGGRNGGAAVGTGASGASAGVVAAPNSNPEGMWINGGSSGGGGSNAAGTAGGSGAPLEGSRSGDGGTTSGGLGPGAPGGGISWMGTSGVGLNYQAVGSVDGLDALAPGAGGGGCVGQLGTARAGGKGGPGCLIAMYWADYA